ncbi:Golgi transport complex subunit 3 [Ceratocystis pirilliformis]|uniref:Conserved oligomeric Golgi complex subunit 3 n=1 Tax=Ceratocystis pirilliformis TaxID=259994 RepID=A0ABR3YYW7_9PEZI
MYDDQWYNFVPEATNKPTRTSGQPTRSHGRKPSLLQQPNISSDVRSSSEISRPVLAVVEDEEDSFPEPQVLRRAASSSDLIHPRQRFTVRKFSKRTTKASRLPALLLEGYTSADDEGESDCDEQLQEKSRNVYIAYQAQLTLTEGHLDNLISDTDDTLRLLESLTSSFKAVELQTTSFRSQCEDLISDQERLKKLSDEVGTDLHYYAYLDNATRRLNAPGASKLVDDSSFADIFRHLDSCIDFMSKHTSYRDAESYLARYQSLLTKALHLLETGLSNKLDKVAMNLAPQLNNTNSESAQHALSYDRFGEMTLESYSLVPNIHEVTCRIYDKTGIHKDDIIASEIYEGSAKNMFYTYLSIRDRHMRTIAHRDIEEYKTSQAQGVSIESASRKYIKQCFERAFNEVNLFAKIFHVLPRRSPDDDSVYAVLKSHQRFLVNPANMAPPGAAIQAGLHAAELRTICNIVGWLSNEYLMSDYDESDSPFSIFSREYAAALLSDHMWPFVERGFEAEVSKIITKAPVAPESLQIPKVVGPLPVSNAYPTVKVALALLDMFDQCMPKERSKQSATVFNIVRETIRALQRIETKMKATKGSSDSDVFMIKNLLVLRNQLVSLEFGDVRQQSTAGGGALGPIWDTINPQVWVGFLSSIMSAAPLPIWSRGLTGSATPVPPPAPALTQENMSEHLDELLRRAIYAFTGKWAAKVVEAEAKKDDGKTLAAIDVELDTLLENVFGNQREVMDRLKEAIDANVEMQKGKK